MLDEQQQSLVYGVIHMEGAHNQTWELKGDIFLAGGCEMQLLPFKLSGRPACLRVRPRVGLKIKDYVFSFETMNEMKEWSAALAAAGCAMVERPPGAPSSQPFGVGSASLFLSACACLLCDC